MFNNLVFKTKIERSQSRRFGHLGRMPRGRLPGEVFSQLVEDPRRSYFLVGFETPWDSPGGVGGSGLGVKCLSLC